MKETQQNGHNLVRQPWQDNDEIYIAMNNLVPPPEELEPSSEWEAGYLAGRADAYDVMRVRISNLFRRDYVRIPERIEEE